MIYFIGRALALFTFCVLTIVACENSSSPPASAQEAEPDSNQSHLEKHTPTDSASAQQTLINGKVTFDQIPREAGTERLDLSNAFPLPVRSAKIDILDEFDNLLYSTVTSNEGEFTALTPPNTLVSIKVWAHIEDTEQGLWSARIVDNTSGYSNYALTTGLLLTTEDPITVEIHAPSGYDDGSYKDTRASAPFAILDALHKGFNFVTEQGASPLPELSVAWSPKNSTVRSGIGGVEEGFIGSSFYSNQDGEPKIYLLGNINNDADDYDRSVILHEFGHYVIEHISRSDSVGGSYNPGSQLDLRVAFNEGLANVIGALIDDTTVYLDAFGNGQNLVQKFDLESHDSATKGWYSTEVVSWVVFDIADQEPLDDESIDLGWSGLYQILTAPETLLFDGAMSIYTLVDVAQTLFPEVKSELEEIALRHGITVTDSYGTDETDFGGSQLSLPLHQNYTPGTQLDLCGDERMSDFNGLDVHRLVRFTVEAEGLYTIKATKQDNELFESNPEFVLFQHGQVKLAGFSSQNGLEQTTHHLTPGLYLLDIFDRQNADNIPNNGGLSCFTLSITPGDTRNATTVLGCDNLASITGDSRCQLSAPTIENLNSLAL